MGCGFWAGVGVCSFAYLQSNLPTFFSRESIVGRHWAAIPSRLIGLGQFHLFFLSFFALAGISRYCLFVCSHLDAVPESSGLM